MIPVPDTPVGAVARVPWASTLQEWCRSCPFRWPRPVSQSPTSPRPCWCWSCAECSAPVCILTCRLAPASSYLTDFVLIERSNLVKAVSTLRRQAEVHLECTPGCGWATDVEAAWLADAVFARLRDTAAQPASPVRREVAPSCGDSGACGGNGPSSPVAPSAARSASSPRTPTPTGGVGGAAAGCHSPRSPRTASSRKHPLVFLPMRLRIAKLEKHAVKSHMHLLVKLLLLQPHGSIPRLVSFTETEDEVWCLVLGAGPWHSHQRFTYFSFTTPTGVVDTARLRGVRGSRKPHRPGASCGGAAGCVHPTITRACGTFATAGWLPSVVPRPSRGCGGPGLL